MGGGHEVAAFAQPKVTLVSGGEGDVQLLGAPDHAVGRLNETGLHLAAAVGTLHHKCSFHTAPDGALRWLYKYYSIREGAAQCLKAVIFGFDTGVGRPVRRHRRGWGYI